MIYIYRRAASDGATLLAEDICLLGTRARRTQGGLLEDVRAGDAIVCWGDTLPAARNFPNVKTLNNVPAISKFEEARRLAAARVPTVQVSQNRPAPARRAPYIGREYDLNAGRYNRAELARVVDHINAFIVEEDRLRREYEARPAAVDEWLPRRSNHVGGSDLLHPPARPDYYSRKENIVEEYRLHMFKGKSIRAGKKIRRPRAEAGNSHEWIRSFDAGWIIAYENFQSTRAQRELAAKAVEALGLDFGAVDLGKKADGSLIVLEVNRAPGIEGGTAETYARKIIAWSKGEL